MGPCLSQNSKEGQKASETSTIKHQEAAAPINDPKQLIINKSIFITKNHGKFRDNYQIGNVLGQGAFGEVRKCINRITKAIRAVKLIRKDAMTPEEEQAF